MAPWAHVSLATPSAIRTYASSHEAESFESFNAKYVSFFDSVDDLFELQRGLNNCFSYDLVPAPEVIESALRASRRVNDLSTAVRVFEGIKEKVENQSQYQKYLDALKPVKEELGKYTIFSILRHADIPSGITLKEELYA